MVGCGECERVAHVRSRQHSDIICIFSAEREIFCCRVSIRRSCACLGRATGRVAGSIRCGRPVVCVCFSTTGDLLTVCEANDSAYLQVWDVELHFTCDIGPHSLGPGFGTKIESSPNGRSVVVFHSAELGCSADRMTMFDLDTDERRGLHLALHIFTFNPSLSFFLTVGRWSRSAVIKV